MITVFRTATHPAAALKNAATWVGTRIKAVHWSTWALLVITGVALLVYLRAIWLTRFIDAPMDYQSDSSGYLRLGYGWAQGSGQLSDGGWPEVGNTPLYPMFIGFLYRLRSYLFNDDPTIRTLIGGAQAFMNAGVVLMVGLLARRRFKPIVGIVASLILLAMPSFIWSTGVIMTEGLFVPLFVLMVTLLVWNEPGSLIPRWQLRLAGFVLALCVLTRPASLSVAVVVVGALWILQKSFDWKAWKPEARAAYRGRWPGIRPAVGVFLIVMSWWVIGFVFMTTEHVAVSANFGGNVKIGNSQGANGKYRDGVTDYSGGDLIESDQKMFAESVGWIIRHPQEQPHLVRERYRETMGRDDYWAWGYAPETHPINHLAMWTDRSVRAWGWLKWLALAGVGIGLASESYRRTTKWWVILVGSSLISPLITFGAPRFHAQLVPFMAIAAALAVVDSARFVHWYCTNWRSSKDLKFRSILYSR